MNYIIYMALMESRSSWDNENPGTNRVLGATSLSNFNNKNENPNGVDHGKKEKREPSDTLRQPKTVYQKGCDPFCTCVCPEYYYYYYYLASVPGKPSVFVVCVLLDTLFLFASSLSFFSLCSTDWARLMKGDTVCSPVRYKYQ